MALVHNRTSPQIADIATAINTTRQAAVGTSKPHADASEVTVTAADSATPATAIALANNLLSVYNFHLGDTLAHKVADSADLTGLSPCVDNTTCIALVLAMATGYETHRASTTYHYTADSTNTLTSTTVTTIGQAETVATDLKAKLNAHMATALAGKSLRVIPG